MLFRNGRALDFCLQVAASHQDAIRQFGLTTFGDQILASSFYYWTIFYSPFGRITEFLLGALAAQRLLGRKIDAIWDRRPGFWSFAAAGAILIWFVVSVVEHIEAGLSCPAALAAAVVLLVPPASRKCTWQHNRGLDGGGKLLNYLLHWYVMALWAGFYANQRPFHERLLIYLAGIAATIAISRVSYLAYERPAQRWLRRNFRPLRLGPALLAAFIVIIILAISYSGWLTNLLA
jgi:peptidoglycan/LPS O-acetylase OafA/YrhL